MKVKVLNTETQVEIREMSLDDWVDQSGECSLGRSPYSGLVLDSPDVSRLHAKFAFESGHYYFYDLGSSNGSMLNGKVVDPQQRQILKPGDIIRVGEFMLTLYPTHDQSESLPATVIGGSEATVYGRLVKPEAEAEAEAEASPNAKVEPQNSDSLLESTLLEDISSTEQSMDGEVNAQIDDEFKDTAAHRLDHSVDPDPDSVKSTDSPIDYTLIQLEPVDPTSPESLIDQAESSTDPTDSAVVELSAEIATDNSIHDQSPELAPDQSSANADSVTETTFIQSEATTDSEFAVLPTVPWSADVSTRSDQATQSETVADLQHKPDPILDTQSDVSDMADKVIITSSMEPFVQDEVPAFYQLAEDTSKTQLIVETENCSDLTEQTEAAETEQETIHDLEETSVPFDNQLPNPEPLIETPDQPVADTLSDADAIELSASETIETTEISDTTCSDTDQPVATQPSSALAEKYVALLAHESQIAVLAELVAQHKTLLSQCLTVATPSVSEMLKQQTGFEVTSQTPTLPVGGFQTINSLITADKVAVVIFLRDFLNAQTNSVNDEAFSRACNIHQVLFASNLPTAAALMQYLQVESSCLS